MHSVSRLFFPLALLGSSSLAVLALRFGQVPFPVLAQLVLLAILAAAMVFAKLVLADKPQIWQKSRWALLWGCSFLVQLAVAVSGGLYSPLLVLILLFFIAASFLLSLEVSIIFIGAAVCTLLVTLLTDPAMFQLLEDDPAVAILYLLSFVVAVPLTMLISRQYRQKDKDSQAFSHQVNLDQTILEQVNDMLFITDANLTVLSVNKSAELELKRAAAELVKKPLLDVLFLRSAQGLLNRPESLDIAGVISRKTPTNLTDLSLMTANSTSPLKVSLQILPLVNLNGQVESLTFILSALQNTETPPHVELSLGAELALMKYQALTEQLKQALALAKLPQLEAVADLTNRISEDVRLSMTLTHMTIEQNRLAVDVAQLCAQVVALQQQFGRLLGATVRWVAPTDGITGVNVALPAQLQTLANSTLSTGPLYTATVDPQWLGVLLQKLLTMSILATVGQTERTITTNIVRTDTGLEVQILATKTNLTDASQLFQADPNRIGSGLEAGLSKELAEKLGVQLQIVVAQQQLICSLHISQRR